MRSSFALSAATLAVVLVLSSMVAAPVAAQQAAAPPDLATLMQAAERIGTGRVTAYRVAGNVLLELPTSALGKPLLWYTEAVALPAGLVVESLEAGNSLVRRNAMATSCMRVT